MRTKDSTAEWPFRGAAAVDPVQVCDATGAARRGAAGFKKIFARIGDSNAWGVRPAAGCMASALCHSLVRQLFWQPGKPG